MAAMGNIELTFNFCYHARSHRGARVCTVPPRVVAAPIRNLQLRQPTATTCSLCWTGVYRNSWNTFVHVILFLRFWPSKWDIQKEWRNMETSICRRWLSTCTMHVPARTES